MRVIVKRILRKNGYAPDKQEKATQLVLEQTQDDEELDGRPEAAVRPNGCLRSAGDGHALRLRSTLVIASASEFDRARGRVWQDWDPKGLTRIP